jgi:hypothetical protein
MADRKQTPDILSEILSGTPTPQSVSAQISAPRGSPKSKAKPASRPIKEPRSKKLHFEFQVVSFQDYKGWRSRFINGKEISNWMSAPLLHEYIQLKADEGWELVCATSGERLYGTSDKRQLFFKRYLEIGY